jgi:hypothetical protein
MQVNDKRDAIRAYKERKQKMGVYAVRCTATGAVWVGRSRNLAAQENRIWFALRLGSERAEGLQDAWNTHGTEAFHFEVVAKLDDADTAYPDAKLKALLAQCRDRLAARPI